MSVPGGGGRSGAGALTLRGNITCEAGVELLFDKGETRTQRFSFPQSREGVVVPLAAVGYRMSEANLSELLRFPSSLSTSSRFVSRLPPPSVACHFRGSGVATSRPCIRVVHGLGCRLWAA